MLQSNFIGWCHGQVRNMHNACAENKVAAIKTFLYMMLIIRSINLVLVATRQIYQQQSEPPQKTIFKRQSYSPI